MRIENAQLIGIAGVARSGKDTLFTCIKEWMLGFDVSCRRIALADQLKKNLAPSLLSVGIDVHTQDTDEKALIRPFLVDYGHIARIKTKGTYWTSLISPEVDTLIDNEALPVITDIRYAQYPEDEVQWLKSKGGILIHVERFDENGRLVLPPNEDEAKNDPILKENSDLRIQWPTYNNIDLIKEFAFEEFNKDF
jgi:hypothetical protein